VLTEGSTVVAGFDALVEDEESAEALDVEVPSTVLELVEAVSDPESEQPATTINAPMSAVNTRHRPQRCR
jgi:hypothetical protein